MNLPVHMRHDAIDAKPNISRVLAEVVKSVYQKPLRLHGYDLGKNGDLVGVFSGDGEVYQFSANPKKGSFKYVEAEPKDPEKMDSYLLGAIVDAGMLKFDAVDRMDRRCGKGKSCGDTCIERGRECETVLSPQASQGLASATNEIAKVKASGGNLPGAAILTAVLGAGAIGAATYATSNQKPIIAKKAVKPEAAEEQKKQKRNRNTAIAVGAIGAGYVAAEIGMSRARTAESLKEKAEFADWVNNTATGKKKYQSVYNTVKARGVSDERAKKIAEEAMFGAWKQSGKPGAKAESEGKRKNQSVKEPKTKTSSGKNYWEVLGVDKNASPAEIKAAYRKLAQKNHPDLNPNSKEAESRMKSINEAYELSKKQAKRKDSLIDELEEAYKMAQTHHSSVKPDFWYRNDKKCGESSIPDHFKCSKPTSGGAGVVEPKKKAGGKRRGFAATTIALLGVGAAGGAIALYATKWGPNGINRRIEDAKFAFSKKLQAEVSSQVANKINKRAIAAGVAAGVGVGAIAGKKLADREVEAAKSQMTQEKIEQAKQAAAARTPIIQERDQLRRQVEELGPKLTEAERKLVESDTVKRQIEAQKKQLEDQISSEYAPKVASLEKAAKEAEAKYQQDLVKAKSDLEQSAKKQIEEKVNSNTETIRKAYEKRLADVQKDADQSKQYWENERQRLKEQSERDLATKSAALESDMKAELEKRTVEISDRLLKEQVNAIADERERAWADASKQIKLAAAPKGKAGSLLSDDDKGFSLWASAEKGLILSSNPKDRVNLQRRFVDATGKMATKSVEAATSEIHLKSRRMIADAISNSTGNKRDTEKVWYKVNRILNSSSEKIGEVAEGVSEARAKSQAAYKLLLDSLHDAADRSEGVYSEDLLKAFDKKAANIHQKYQKQVRKIIEDALIQEPNRLDKEAGIDWRA